MSRKKHFIIIDTETSITHKVVDFGAVIVDKQGNIVNKCGVMVNGVFGHDPLFYDPSNLGIWAKASLTRRMDKYSQMLAEGSRMLASVSAINRWLERAAAQYNPELTAYNLAFDVSKCRNTGIDVSMFESQFCLWGAAIGNICKTKAYRQFVLRNHLFNKPTEYRNMTYLTNAESVAGFLNGEFITEPHTALEDAIDFEVPILRHILKKRRWKDNVQPYNWKEFQVKDHFKC